MIPVRGCGGAGPVAADHAGPSHSAYASKQASDARKHDPPARSQCHAKTPVPCKIASTKKMRRRRDSNPAHTTRDAAAWTVQLRTILVYETPADLFNKKCPRQQKMSTWLVWACGAPLNKFSDPEMHFPSSWTYVTHAYKFEGRWYI